MLAVSVQRVKEGSIRLATPITFRVIPISYHTVEQDMIQIPDELQLSDDIRAPIFAIG